MNRVTNAIEKTRKAIADRIASGLVTQAKVDALHKTLDMSFHEYCRFQELKSMAGVNGKLTMEEAQTIYAYLGNTPDHFNSQPVEVKSILTKIKIFAELLAR